MISRNLKLLIVLLIVGSITAYVVLVTIPTQLVKRSYEAAKTLGEDFKKAFQFTPEITVDQTIVLNQQTQVFELAVLSQNFGHDYIWTNTWLGSTKQIFITGSFEAKAGFDLHRRFSIELTDDKAYVTLPEPSLLSIESQGDITYRDENGMWNWVDMNDRTKATNAFIKDARVYAAQAVFVKDARSKMEEQLKTLLKPYAEEVIIRYETSVTIPAPN
ncbi:MAG: DUF4230 domain-containing protein [Cyclobacteriaceae bacterium]|nr:DUF4230 domain-containing protein [Cyclobacteriaceae bacterium]